MNSADVFKLPRFGRFLALELFTGLKGTIIALVISFGFLFHFVMLLTPVFTPATLEFTHHQGYAFVLIVVGFILTSLSFNDLGHPLKRIRYLVLPVSTLEKFASMWLITTIGWVVVFTLLYTAYAWFANAVGQVIFRNIAFVSFDPFGNTPLMAVRYYLVFQGVFLVAATHFSGYVFPKVLLTLVLFASLCGILAWLFLKGTFQVDLDLFAGDTWWNHSALAGFVLKIKWLFWWAFAPLCWMIAFLGLKDKEA